LSYRPPPPIAFCAPSAARGHFPQRVGVVIESADEFAVDDEGDVRFAQELLHALEVGARFLRQRLRRARHALRRFASRGSFESRMRSVFSVKRRCESSLKLARFGSKKARSASDIALSIRDRRGLFSRNDKILHAAAAVEIHLKQDALDVLLGLGGAEGFAPNWWWIRKRPDCGRS
jgi:hypothetical protein